MTDKNAKGIVVQHSGYARIEDFYTDYANNVFLEPSFWDLKLVFGQLDQSTNPATTEQRAALTIPWTQAKILNFLLTAHIYAYELKNEKIIIPPDIIPPEAPPPTEDLKESEPYLSNVFEHLRKLRAEFFDLKKS